METVPVGLGVRVGYSSGKSPQLVAVARTLGSPSRTFVPPRELPTGGGPAQRSPTLGRDLTCPQDGLRRSGMGACSIRAYAGRGTPVPPLRPDFGCARLLTTCIPVLTSVSAAATLSSRVLTHGTLTRPLRLGQATPISLMTGAVAFCAIGSRRTRGTRRSRRHCPCCSRTYPRGECRGALLRASFPSQETEPRGCRWFAWRNPTP